MKKKFVTMLLVTAVIVPLVSGCRGKEVDEMPGTTEFTQEAVEDEDEYEEEAELELSKKVSIDNLTFTPIDYFMYDKISSMDEYIEQGYVIEATIINENDYSCDVFPTFSFTMTEEDNYGDKQVRDIILHNEDLPGAILSPYGVYGDRVSLAPNEKKDVRIYLHSKVEGIYLNEQGEPGKPWEEGYEYREISVEEMAGLSNIQLYSLEVSEAKDIYVPINETDIATDLKEVDLLGTQGADGWGKIITGTITNNTADRWKRASINFDLVMDGINVGSTILEFEYVDRGDVVQLFDDSTINNREYYTRSTCAFTYDEPEKHQADQVKLIPTLLSYEPDNGE